MSSYYADLESQLGWVHTCNVTAYRNTGSWQCGRDSSPRNVLKVGYEVTLRAFSVCCRYLAVASKGSYGYGRSRCRRATWRCTSTPECSVICEMKWKNMLQLDRPQITIKYVLFACWINKAIVQHSEYVTAIAFSRQDKLSEHVWTFRLLPVLLIFKKGEFWCRRTQTLNLKKMEAGISWYKEENSAVCS
jgi:hypothetical protein